MRVYLDVCCLKRPFDSLDDAMVRLEAEAVASILVLPSERVTLVRSGAQRLENSLNPVRWRREAVASWLDESPPAVVDEAELTRRTSELIAAGFKNFDAFHLATEEACADVFVTVDQRLKRRAAVSALHLRVVSPVALLEEVSVWKT